VYNTAVYTHVNGDMQKS